MSRENRFERRLERGRGFIDRLVSDVTVRAHDRRRNVTHLSLDDPVRLSLLGQARERGVASIMGADVIEASRLA